MLQNNSILLKKIVIIVTHVKYATKLYVPGFHNRKKCFPSEIAAELGF